MPPDSSDGASAPAGRDHACGGLGRRRHVGFRTRPGAPGWHPIALSYIGLPTALSYEENVDAGGYVFDPERRAAGTSPAICARPASRWPAGRGPGWRPTDTARRGGPLRGARRHPRPTERRLEQPGRRDAVEAAGADGTGSRARSPGRRVIEEWADARGAGVRLPMRRASPTRPRGDGGMATLLDGRCAEPWGEESDDPGRAGRGHARRTVSGLAVRAKTGTLIDDVSALSGYVRLAEAIGPRSRSCPGCRRTRPWRWEDAIVRASPRTPRSRSPRPRRRLRAGSVNG